MMLVKKTILNLTQTSLKVKIMLNKLRLRIAKVSTMNFIGHFKKSMQNKIMWMIVLKLYRIFWIVAMIPGHQNILPTLLFLMLKETK